MLHLADEQKCFRNVLKGKRNKRKKPKSFISLFTAYFQLLIDAFLRVIYCFWVLLDTKNETMWSDICLIIPEFVLVLVRGWIV